MKGRTARARIASSSGSVCGRPIAEALKAAAVPRKPGLRNSNRLHSSPRWFSIGVPLSASRCPPFNRRTDFAAAVALGVAYRGLKDFAAAKKTWDRVISDAPRRSTARADAMFDTAILALDFMKDEAAGKAALEQYLQEAPVSHAKRQIAEEKRKELGK